MHARELGLGCDLIGLFLLLVDVVAKAELATQHDSLRDKTALLPSAVRAAANLVALVADGGIGVESSLPGLRFRTADHGCGLLQGRIVVVGHGKKVFQLEWGARGNTLQ